MPHPYPIREIARQSGLSEATVDRVLNRRPGVRPSTAAHVAQAIADLDRQRSQLRLTGRTFIVDLVMQTPDRFSAAVQAALELELPMLRPAVVRSRFDFRERARPDELAKSLDGIRHRGSMGVILKAPDDPEIIDAVARLHDSGIPVVTLVTDIPLSQRVAYVGIDNRAAGATAAYLIDQWFGDEDGAVREQTISPLREHPDVTAVYSIGGGNRAILDAFDVLGRECRAFVAHDLDRDNLALIQERRISAILHHDLRQDMRRACQVVMQANGAIDGPIESVASQINVVTPHNIPAQPVG